MSAEEAIDFVEVQYDYSYDDEDGVVDIKVGDRYLLLEKTTEEWWKVQRPGDGNSVFFVPAHYVLIVADPDTPRGDEEESNVFEDVATEGERVSDVAAVVGERSADEDPGVAPVSSSSPSPPPPVAAESACEQIYANTECFRKQPSLEAEQTEAMYANLDDFRAVAQILQKAKENVDQGVADQAGEYANLPFVQGSIPPPPATEGEYVRQLLEGLPWHVYKEPFTGRLYYINAETQERSWKPPRKDRPHHSPTESRDMAPPSPREGPIGSASGGPTSPRVHFQETNSIPSEYERVEDQGTIYYVNRHTQDKWQTSADHSGKVYYYRTDSGETSWELPLAQPDQDKENRTQYPGSHHSLQRLGKSRSLYGMRPPDKASTLPANFSPSRSAPAPPGTPPEPSPSSTRRPGLTHSRTAPSLTQLPIQSLSDILNRTKLTESGKKVKKSWAQSYVVLSGSNLVMYKDQKAAMIKPGSPHGKAELVVSMQGAKIDFNPKDISSRKNTILVSNPTSGIQVLLQHDEEVVIHKWLVRLKLAADDISDVDEGDPVKGGGLTRQGSSVRGSSVDESGSRSIKSIRTRLVNLITRRPPQEELVKRGIIKDAIFGSSLQELCLKEHSNVPVFVKRCIAAVELRGLDHDGMYRISGNLAEVQRLRYVVDKDDTGQYNLDDEQWDVHVLTGALKLFFRELKDPLFPADMFDKFTKAIQLNSHRSKVMRELVKNLPRCHIDTMRALFEHLLKVIKHSDQNRMQIHNVAIVFGPTLMWSEAGDGLTLAAMTVYQSKVVEHFLSHFGEIFK